jgi:hypothetical protein
MKTFSVERENKSYYFVVGQMKTHGRIGIYRGLKEN